MKPVITGIVLMALLISRLGYAQNDTPMEVLVNIAHENERFIPYYLFSEDDREIAYLQEYLEDFVALKLNTTVLERILEEAPATVSFELPFTNGETLKSKIINHDIRSEDFSVIDLQTNEILETPKAEFYRGTLERAIDGMAGFSFFENEVYGIMSSEHRGNIVLIPDPINPGEGQNYVLYSENDLKIERAANCGADQFSKINSYTESVTRNNTYSTCDDVEVYVESTYKLYQAKGSSSTATTNYISAFFNNAAVIYRNEGIYTSLKRVAINSSEDGYSNLTSSFDNLNQFGENKKNTYQQYGAELAHLVDYNEQGLGGIAWINAMCNNYYYFSSQDYHFGAYAYSSVLTTQANFPDYSLTVFMFAHEMGHNLGSQHTQWCGWDGGPIDNCAPVEKGPCNAGPTPTNGGTIMSYCHNKSNIGINFSKGFADQPGDLIRSRVASKTCVEEYIPKGVVPASPRLTITANRECTDENGWTNYYYDNNTSNEADDELLLSVKKSGENIGNLDDGTLKVQVMTSSKAGNGSTHITDPGYNVGSDWYVMNRWFELHPTDEPNNPVTVRFPYTTDDLMDVMTNQPAVNSHNDLIFYKVNTPGDPNPDNGHESISNDDITFYMNGTTPSLSTWKYVKSGTFHMAEFQVNSFSGGGGGFTQETGSSLPVTIVSYSAKIEEESIWLNWETATEINNDFFTIEHSKDGENYQKIGKIIGSGTSSKSVNYNFEYRNPEAGLNYFRLSQTDFDGTHVYIGVRAIEFKKTRAIEIYPNPLTSNTLTLNYYNDQKSVAKMLVRNLEGKLVYSTDFDISRGSNQLSFPLGNISSGIYMVQIMGSHEIYTTKLIKD